MKSENKKEFYFENINEDFDDWMSLYDVSQRIKIIKKMIPNDAYKMSCIEIGCGTGQISKSIKPIVKSLTVSDISKKLASKVGQELDINWLQLDACNIDLPEKSYDIIISSECIEHTLNPKKALSEMIRILKPGGHIIITSPNKLWYPVLWFSIITKIRKYNGIENWLFPGETAKILNNYGVTNLKINGCHLFPWQIPFAKKILPIFDKYGVVLYPFMINYGIYGKKLF